jgi:hypothetical protein
LFRPSRQAGRPKAAQDPALSFVIFSREETIFFFYDKSVNKSFQDLASRLMRNRMGHLRARATKTSSSLVKVDSQKKKF